MALGLVSGREGSWMVEGYFLEGQEVSFCTSLVPMLAVCSLQSILALIYMILSFHQFIPFVIPVSRAFLDSLL